MKCPAASGGVAETKIRKNLLITLTRHLAKSHHPILILREGFSEPVGVSLQAAKKCGCVTFARHTTGSTDEAHRAGR
ncbi:hypothetical protein DENIT_90195 [Pseudomonas veronii]|nr:hypothetical protein DENIT_90195 [Pseudomonas veronii]